MHFKSIARTFSFRVATFTILGVIVTLAMWTCSPNASQITPHVLTTESGYTNKEARVASAPSATTLPDFMVNGIATPPSPRWSDKLYGRLAAKDPLLLDPDQAEKRLDELLQAAADGHANAPVTLFRLAVSCGLVDSVGTLKLDRKLIREVCKRLLAAAQGDPRDWLLLAAERGSADALVPAVGMARGLARSQANTDESTLTTKVVITALEQAARRGNKEAFILLWRTYTDGVITNRNPIVAYAYIDAYAQATREQAAEREARTLRNELRPGDYIAARSIQNELAVAISSYGK